MPRASHPRPRPFGNRVPGAPSGGHELGRPSAGADEHHGPEVAADARQRLGWHHQGPAVRLHRCRRHCSRSSPRRLRQALRSPLPGDRAHLEGTLERVHPIPCVPTAGARVIYTTNLIESMNAQLRKVTRNRGNLPSGQAALKVLHLAVRNLDEYRSPNTDTRSRLETSPAGVHDLLRRTDPHPMTATVGYTEHLTVRRGPL